MDTKERDDSLDKVILAHDSLSGRTMIGSVSCKTNLSSISWASPGNQPRYKSTSKTTVCMLALTA